MMREGVDVGTLKKMQQMAEFRKRVGPPREVPSLVAAVP